MRILDEYVQRGTGFDLESQCFALCSRLFVSEGRAMDEDHMKRIILEFLRKQTFAVIATCHRNGTPEAAAVDFSVRDNLEIVFDTFKDTRKFNNIAERPGVAFVVGWNDNITVQY